MDGKPRLNWIDQMVKRPPPPTVKELRQFGLVMGLFVAVFFGLLFPWLWNLKIALWPWIAGSLLIIWALAAPATLAPVFHIWMTFAGVMGRINTRIILTLVFYLVFVPIGLFMRLWGWDPLRRSLHKNTVSYRIQTKAANRKQMEKPF